MIERIYIVVPAHNRRLVTARFAQALRAQTWRAFQLVLIDDGSTDGTADEVLAVLPDTAVVRGSGTWWWAGCMSAAWTWLSERHVPDDAPVGLLNDDVEIPPTFLADAWQHLHEAPHTLLLARQVDATSGRAADPGGVHFDCRRFRFTSTSDEETINCLPTRGLFARWSDFQRVGGFRPRWLPHYLADYEFTFRARRHGLNLRVSDRFAVRTHAADTGWTREALWAVRRTERLRLIFSNRYKDNPRALLAFAWLTAPGLWRFWTVTKVLAASARLVADCVLRPVRVGGTLIDAPERAKERCATNVQRADSSHR